MYYTALIVPLLSSVLFPLDITQAPEETSAAVHTEEVKVERMTTKQNAATACNCVATARTRRPDLKPMDASMYKPSTTTPFMGAIAVMRYPSGVHHIAYVENVGKGYVDLYNGNVEPCKITRERMYIPNKRIKGYL